MRPSRICAFLTVLSVCAGLTVPAYAGTLEVKPIRVELTKGQHIATFTVTNEGAEPVRIQVTAFAWDMTQGGQMQLTHTDDLFFFPPLLTIPPRGARSVRLGLDVAPGARERSFRIYFEEMPSLLSQLQPSLGATIMLREKIGVPIFLEPADAYGRAVVQDVSVQGRRLRFALADAGTEHINVSNVAVTGFDGSGKTLFNVPVTSWYILAGEKRVYDIPVPAAACKGLERIAVSGKVDAGSDLHSTVPVSCAR